MPATLIKMLKGYINNPKMNDPDFVNLCFSSIVKNKRVENKNNEMFEFSNSRTSELLHGDISIPNVIMNELEDPNLLDIIRKEFYEFVDDNFDSLLLPSLISDILDLIKSDSLFPREKIVKFEKCISNPREFILLAFIESLKVENKDIVKDDEIIWKRGNSCIKAIPADIFKFGFTKRKKNKNIVVIPVDTSFCMNISEDLETNDKPMVSTETLHGMWIKRCQNSNIPIVELEKRIHLFLSNNKIKFKVENNRNHYPIGTVVSLEINNGIFF